MRRWNDSPARGVHMPPSHRGISGVWQTNRRLKFNPQRLPYLGGGDSPFAQDVRLMIAHVHDSRAQVRRKRTALDTEVYEFRVSSQLLGNAVECRRRFRAAYICTGRRKGFTEFTRERETEFIFGDTYAYRRKIVPDAGRDGRLFFKNEGKRPRQKGLCEPPAQGRNFRILLHHPEVCENGVNRASFIAVLYHADLFECQVGKRVRAEPVERIGRVQDDPARPANPRAARPARYGRFESFKRMTSIPLAYRKRATSAIPT